MTEPREMALKSRGQWPECRRGPAWCPCETSPGRGADTTPRRCFHGGSEGSRSSPWVRGR